MLPQNSNQLEQSAETPPTLAASTAAKPKKKPSAEKIAERVYQMLLADARLERERRG